MVNTAQPVTGIRVLLDVDTGVDVNWIPDVKQLQDWIALAWESQSVQADEQVEVSVALVSLIRMQALNLHYRDQDKPTNVLSFAADMPALAVPAEAQHDTEKSPGRLSLSSTWLRPLGDIVLCPSVLSEEAEAQNKSIEHHWAHLVVHGVLHLCGLDHQTSVQADVMELAEIRILSKAGIANPYGPQGKIF